MAETDYRSTTRKCDIVMKGGITSGIVYPRAVSRLAREYKFHSIGGTSAGAIAAAVTAAAEYSRSRGHIVFDKLDEIPTWLGQPSRSGGSNLLSLFQPQKQTSGLFKIALALLVKPWWRRIIRLLSAVWLDVLVGALPGAGVIAIGVHQHFAVSVVLGSIITLAGVAVSTIAGTLIRLIRLRRYHFGICTGYADPTQPDKSAPLTEWLNDLLNSLAQHDSKAPLTFGDLDSHDITLKAIATCLTLGRPYSLPFESDEFYFSPQEMGLFFPPEVVSWMEQHSPTSSTHSEAIDACGLKRLPSAKHLPVIVAVRMSLSFPILFCAVPLYAVDWTRRWRGVHEEVPDRRVPGDALDPDELRRPERVWFSDGGICSNFPLHLFDSPLPRWPTFALDLADGRPDRPADENRVWMPTSNRGGIAFRWARLDSKRLVSIVDFLASIVDSARNWVDSLQAMVPGYRDRIAHIYLDAEEGGLNLTMSAATVDKIANYGEMAGRKLCDRFLRGMDAGTPTNMNWENHRWVRYRSTMATLAAFLSRFKRAYESSDEETPNYSSLVTHGEKMKSYPFTQVQAECAGAASEEFVRMSKQIDACRLDKGSPLPEPALRVRPQY